MGNRVRFSKSFFAASTSSRLNWDCMARYYVRTLLSERPDIADFPELHNDAITAPPNRSPAPVAARRRATATKKQSETPCFCNILRGLGELFPAQRRRLWPSNGVNFLR